MLKPLSLSLAPLAALLVSSCGQPSETSGAADVDVVLQTELPAVSSGPYRIEYGPAGGAGPWVLIEARDNENYFSVSIGITGRKPESAAELTFDDGDSRHILYYVSRSRREESYVEVQRTGGSPAIKLSETGPWVGSARWPSNGSPFPNTYDPSTLTAVSACKVGSETGTLWRASPVTDPEFEWEACVTNDGITLPNFWTDGAEEQVTLRVVRGPVDPALFDPANALRLVEPVAP